MNLVIISQQGSGTNLLRSFLNSHADICVLDEIFTKSKEFNELKKEDGNEDAVRMHVENKLSELNTSVRGFDLKYNNIEKIPEILDYLKKEEFQVIHLFRCKGRTFLRNLNEDKKGKIGYNDLKKHVDRVSGWQEKVREELKGIGYVELTYEEMTRGREIEELPTLFEQTILAWLGVDYQKLHITEDNVRKEKLKMRY